MGYIHMMIDPWAKQVATSVKLMNNFAMTVRVRFPFIDESSWEWMEGELFKLRPEHQAVAVEIRRTRNEEWKNKLREMQTVYSDALTNALNPPEYHDLIEMYEKEV